MSLIEACPYLIDPSGLEHALEKPITVIGRAIECDIVVTNKRVSREHARLRREGRRVVAEDLNSTNGTSVNDEHVFAPVELRDGDSLQVGDVRFVFHDPESTYSENQFPALEVNVEAGLVHVNRRAITLSPKEFALLAYLFERRGKVCSKEEIGRAVWPEYQEGIYDYQIENLVRRLRSRLEPDPDNAQMLMTVRGQGYKLTIR